MVLDIQIRFKAHQESNGRLVTFLSCNVKRRISLIVGLVDVLGSLTEQVDHSIVTFRSSDMQQGLSLLIFLLKAYR